MARAAGIILEGSGREHGAPAAGRDPARSVGNAGRVAQNRRERPESIAANPVMTPMRSGHSNASFVHPGVTIDGQCNKSRRRSARGFPPSGAVGDSPDLGRLLITDFVKKCLYLILQLSGLSEAPIPMRSAAMQRAWGATCGMTWRQQDGVRAVDQADVGQAHVGLGPAELHLPPQVVRGDGCGGRGCRPV